MPKTCLVGGSGFIGTALARELLAAGRTVSVIDHHAPSLPDVEFFEGDYSDETFAAKALEGVDEVVMLAYASVPKTSFDDPFADIQSNLPPTLHFFKLAIAAKVKKLVVISSGGTVYGVAETTPITESHPTNPISPYGITKLAVEKYAHMFHVLYGMPYVIVRPGNAYGPGQRPYTGQGLVATAIASLMQHKELTMFGGEEIVRDYVHVEDLAKAITAVLEHGQIAATYNIGTAVGTSNKTVVDLVEAEAKRQNLDPVIKRQPARPFDVPTNVLDSGKLTDDTGWKPTKSFEEGVKETWAWLQTNLS